MGSQVQEAGEFSSQTQIAGANKNYLDRKAQGERRNLLFFIIGATVAIALIIVFINVAVGSHKSARDAGLALCDRMAVSTQTGATTGTIDRVEYESIVKQFNRSAYPDVSTAGVELATALYGYQTRYAAPTGNDEYTYEKMIVGLRVLDKYENFRDACTAHGVDIPDISTSAGATT